MIVNNQSGRKQRNNGWFAWLGLSLLSLVVLLNPAEVQAQFTYITNNGSIIITSYTGPSTAVCIPSTLDGYPVTSIGDYAFSGYFLGANPTKVTIPDSVTNIGNSAFYGCFSLTNVIIGSGVKAGASFGYCPLLNSIDVSELNSAYSSIKGILFDKEQFALLQFPPAHEIQNYAISNRVTTIGGGAFNWCYNVTNVLIPNSITTIGPSAFYHCTSLTRITIPNSVTSLGPVAFRECGLKEITIPNSINIIYFQTFLYCSSLTSVVIPGNVTSIGDGAFEGCSSLKNIDIPYSVTSIGSAAFEASGLQSITIPSSVTTIESQAFDICGGLTNVAIPNSIKSIGNLAFYNCPLSSLTIPNSVTNIGSDVFSHCFNLTSVYFTGNSPTPNSDLSVFQYDSNATAYYLPGTTGWGPIFDGIPTVLWNPQAKSVDGSFGVHNNQFGFNITGASNLVIVVKACTNLANPIWTSVATNTLTFGTSYFNDLNWTNYPSRFYGFSWP